MNAMTPETPLLVTDKSAIIMPNKSLAKPGTIVKAGDFAKHAAQLEILLAAGNLTRDLSNAVSGLDVNRVDEMPPAIPNEIDLKTGKGMLRSVAGAGEAATRARLKEIEAAQAATRKHQETLAEIGEGAELNVDEARALGLLKS